jgi:hypothetical protein
MVQVPSRAGNGEHFLRDFRNLARKRHFRAHAFKDAPDAISYIPTNLTGAAENYNTDENGQWEVSEKLIRIEGCRVVVIICH